MSLARRPIDYEEAAQLARIEADRRLANARAERAASSRPGLAPKPAQGARMLPRSMKQKFPYAQAALCLGLLGAFFGLAYPTKPPGIPPLPPPSP